MLTNKIKLAIVELQKVLSVCELYTESTRYTLRHCPSVSHTTRFMMPMANARTLTEASETSRAFIHLWHLALQQCAVCMATLSEYNTNYRTRSRNNGTVWWRSTKISDSQRKQSTKHVSQSCTDVIHVHAAQFVATKASIKYKVRGQL